MLEQLIVDWHLDGTKLVALGLLFSFLLFFFLALSALRGGRSPHLRPIRAFDGLERLIEASSESAQLIHCSLGTASLVSRFTAEVLAGLTMLRALAKRAVASRFPLVVTTLDPVSLAASQGILARAGSTLAEGQVGKGEEARFVAPEPVSYAAGIMGLLNREHPLGNVIVGGLGDEYLLMGEVGAREGIYQVVGTSAPQVLPFVVTSADEYLLGEEMFAAGAYVEKNRAHLGSLLAQDWTRELIIGIIIGLVILRTAGLL
ncbi:MAG: hypothetical protein M1136_05335 [Chloroflexi bacterium]|nr:hypothetical protein [Chloroflexota bacterium]MCL5075060.1 hypothetical protein [Chloroflexota bacterium]